jgi:hypothetical protein
MFHLIREKVKDSEFQVIITDQPISRKNGYQEMITESGWDGVKKLVPLDWIEQ